MPLDLYTFLTTVYVTVDDLYRAHVRDRMPKRRGPAPTLTDSEVLALAILAFWGRKGSERAFWRWAHACLRPYFPKLTSQSRFNRRARLLWKALGLLFNEVARAVTPGSPYHVLDATPLPVCQVPRMEHSVFRGMAALSWCAARKMWYYGYKLFLSVTPAGAITSAALTPANTGDRPGAELIFQQEQRPCYLADKGFCSKAWEAYWYDTYGVTVLAAPYRRHKRAWPGPYARWMSGLRQTVEQVNGALKDEFHLEYPGAKTEEGLFARVAGKLAAYMVLMRVNHHFDRPLRNFADICAW